MAAAASQGWVVLGLVPEQVVGVQKTRKDAQDEAFKLLSAAEWEQRGVTSADQVQLMSRARVRGACGLAPQQLRGARAANAQVLTSLP